MATDIPGDVSSVVPIEYQDASGNPAPPPVGDTVTVQCDSAAIDAHVEEDGSGHRSLVLTPAQPPQGEAVTTVQITDTLSDGAVLTVSEAFKIAASGGSTVSSMHLRLDMITTRPLPGTRGARVTISR